jgi:IclR family transcriptional regulator, KDG regulon repressor
MQGRSIKSAERTLRLFELFSVRECPLTVGQVAQSLSIPQPSASMLLRNLAEMGYLDYDRLARSFVPTIRVMLLGSWISRRFHAVGNIAEHLDRLHDEVHETAFLAIQNDSRGQYVLAREINRKRRFLIHSGLMRPLTCSAMGRIFLSLKPDVEVLSWVRRCNAEVSERRQQVQEVAFMRLIQGVRQKGYAETAGETTPGLGAIAIAIPSPVGAMPMAVGVGAPLDRLTRKKGLILRALRDFHARFGEADISFTCSENDGLPKIARPLPIQQNNITI